MTKNEREQMNVVIVGHVDHGKSTLIGRLLADTGSLPDGKLEQVKATCKKNSKPFEYAFLLDALKDEQSQGITIDTARSFFKSKKRDYIIIDAPGHIEFLKNMITGAARAEAAMLLIDANEGIKENSKRHGYMMSFLGINHVNVVVNKMDLVNYSQDVFNKIVSDYSKFLKEINLKPISFIPISAREGDNITVSSPHMNWYKGLTILEAFDDFKKTEENYNRDFRFPLQDIYKFTNEGDDRRIVAGRIESGTIHVGDPVVFLPSNKESSVATIEKFPQSKVDDAFAGQCAGFTLNTQIYIRPGELMCRLKERLPHVSNKFKANIFWMGKQPLVKGKNYKLKIATQQVPVVLSEIISVLDASELSSIKNKPQVDRHDVAECVLETLKPVAFDEISVNPETGRFVIVDHYEITGGGIILAPVFEESKTINDYVRLRNVNWDRGSVSPEDRTQCNQHKSALVLFTGPIEIDKLKIAKLIEKKLFDSGKLTYFLGIPDRSIESGSTTNDKILNKSYQIQHLGEMSHMLTDAGFLLLACVSGIDQYDLEIIKSLNSPNKTIVINLGEKQIDDRQINLNFEHQGDIQSTSAKIIDYLNKAVILDPEFTI